MSYIVTMEPGTDDEFSWEVLDEDIYRVLRNAFPPYGKLRNGEVIMIRRADYIDTKTHDLLLSVPADRPHLTVLQGGRVG